MYRKFIATVAAASIAITALGTPPAAADQRDAARIAAAVLGIAIIGKIIHDKKKRDEEREVSRRHAAPHSVYRPVERQYRVEPRPLPRRVERYHARRDDRWDRRDDRWDHRANRKLLPQECFRGYETRRGTVYMFGNRCLQRSFRYADRLPQACAQRVRTRDGIRSGYDARCLRNQGYQLARG